MWPTALQLTRDECRGILRRLELESYANVISVFRAQGGLTDNKSKLLEDLRNVFHISQERHRAEARRVANDEQLSTIAEAISGPNTYQEWSREGRRPYPLLPRVPPQTALCVVANNVAAEVTNENSQLPYPSETGSLQQPKKEFPMEQASETSSIPVVKSDPFKPEIPDLRKTLKRNLPTEAPGSTKKRFISETTPSATSGEPPLSPATQIRKLYHNHSKTQSKAKNTPAKNTPAKSTPVKNTPAKNTPAKKSPTKRPTAASAKKRLISGEPVDSNKANNINQTVRQSQAAIAPAPPNNPAALSSSVSNSTSLEIISPPPAPPAQTTQLPIPSSSIKSPEMAKEFQLPAAPPAAVANFVPTTVSPLAGPIAPSTIVPQIATSKKDISKNLSKLNLIAANQPMQQQQQQQQPDKLPECKTEKLSTPVQKYIVDNRTPMQQSTQFLDKQQVITTKLKPMTTIVPTQLSSSSKAKVTSVKTIKSGDILCSTPVSSQPQVFNIIDASSPPYLPHTPPAIINISSKFEPEHGKVLKTKLLPLMLSSGGKLEPNNANLGQLKNTPGTSANVFRKPGIIKTSMPPTIKQKIHITNQQIITPPTVASLKMSPHLHLKGVPGGGPIHNRNSVKIFSSANGKMFIQSADSAAKPMTKVNTILPAQKGIINTSAPPGRIAIQKVHIIPAPGSTVTSSSGTALGNVTMPKSMAITKSNMILMPMTGQQTMKNMPIVKNNKFATAVLPTQIATQETSANSTVGGGGSSGSGTTANPKSNVIVIGSVPSMSQTILPKEMQAFNNRNSMITEDTPVDIITTPMIVDVQSIASTQPLKPTETIDLTTMSDSHSNSPPQIGKGVKGAAGTGVGTVTLLPNRPPTSEKSSFNVKSSNEIIESNATIIQEAQQHQQDSMVIGVTDWEMELDQEANKSRAINEEKIRKRNSVETMVIGSEPEEEDASSNDEHFVEDDVIEEHEETEEEIDIAAGVERDERDKKREEELTEKKRQQEQEAANRHHQFEEDEEETIEVGDEHMKSSEGDVIQYDESYESVNDELDENITIEYVEDEQDGYEEKINSASADDEKETTTDNSSNIVTKPSADNPIVIDHTTESSENKSQSSQNDCMVSVEEITSTTQQNISANSKSDPDPDH